MDSLEYNNFTIHVNNLGYAMQTAGMMVPYDTTVEFDWDYGG